MTKALAHTYTTVHTYRVFIMRAVCLVSALAIVWYCVNVYSAISRTIAAGHVLSQVSTMSNTVNQLGSEYIKLSHSASPSALATYDMTMGHVTAFIPQNTSLGSVAFSGHEF